MMFPLFKLLEGLCSLKAWILFDRNQKYTYVISLNWKNEYFCPKFYAHETEKYAHIFCPKMANFLPKWEWNNPTQPAHLHADNGMN